MLENVPTIDVIPSVKAIDFAENAVQVVSGGILSN